MDKERSPLWIAFSRVIPVIAVLTIISFAFFFADLQEMIAGNETLKASETKMTSGDIVAWIKDHPLHVGIPTFALLVYLRFFKKG